MSFNKRFFPVGGIVASSEAACTTDTADKFGDGYGVALYTLDYDASDASGNYDGTPTNVEFGVGGQINYGARFNGSSSYISSSNILDTSSAFSYSVWIKPQTIGLYDYLVGHQQAGSPYAGVGLIGTASNTFSIALAGSAPQVMTPSLTLDSWSHIVLTHDGSGNYTCYTNNNGSPITYSGATSNDASNPFRIGFSSVSGWGYFDGDIDQVRVFNKELNSTEVSTLFAETACEYTCTTDTVDYPTTNVAYYKLDNNATDETGSYDGTPANINYAFGRFGQAAVFNGSSSYIDTSISGATLGELFSVSVWFKTSTTSTFQTIFDNGGNTSGSTGFAIIIGTDNILKALFTNSGGGGGVDVFSLSTGATVTDGNWHHCVLTYNDESAKIYLDNSTPSTGTNTEPFTQAANDLRIGAYYASGTSLNFNGDLDQIRVFTSELDSTQVTQLYEEKPCADTSTFKTVLYEGNSSTQYISNVGFEPDFVWVKSRDSSSYYHNLFDSVRGATYRLFSNLTNAQDANGRLSSFDANGFSLTSGGDANTSGQSMVAWCWKAGGDAVTDSSTGDITADISANQDAGFSIVKYTGNGIAGSTVPHGLSSAPEFIVTKGLSGTDPVTNWKVYNSTIGNTKYLHLNSTIAATTASVWNDTSPTSSVFSLGSSADNNGSGTVFIAYCFHSVSGVSKVGTYLGNGTNDNKIFTTDDGLETGSGGFEPSFVMIKNTDVSGTGWLIMDKARDPYNTAYKVLRPNVSNAEDTSTSYHLLDWESDGFRLKYGTSVETEFNQTNKTYIYLAFA